MSLDEWTMSKFSLYDNNNNKESPWDIHPLKTYSTSSRKKTFTVIERSAYAYNPDTKTVSRESYNIFLI